MSSAKLSKRSWRRHSCLVNESTVDSLFDRPMSSVVGVGYGNDRELVDSDEVRRIARVQRKLV